VHKSGEEDYIVRSHGNYWMRRSVTAELELEPGEYHVLLKVEAERIGGALPVEEVVRNNAKARRDKLLRVGLAYDLAHAKGEVKLTDEEKKLLKKVEAKKKAKERKEMKDKMMKDKKKRKHNDNKELRKQRAAAEKRKAKAKAKAAKKAEKETLEKEKREKEELEKTKKDELDKKEKDAKAAEAKPEAVVNPDAQVEAINPPTAGETSKPSEASPAGDKAKLVASATPETKKDEPTPTPAAEAAAANQVPSIRLNNSPFPSAPGSMVEFDDDSDLSE